MKNLLRIIFLFAIGMTPIIYGSQPPLCPSVAVIGNTVNALQATNPYADGYNIHEENLFNTSQPWWLRVSVDLADAANNLAALQLIKDTWQTLQWQSGPELNPDQSWWFCYYTLTMPSQKKTIVYLYTSSNE